METRILGIAIGLSLLAVNSAEAQIVSGVMTVTGAEMHWWGGVARDATARLYDVDDDSVVYKKPSVKRKYNQGTITFRAKKGKLVSLDKLHESIWATRLSGGTRSGLVSLDVTTVGEVVVRESETVLKVDGSNQHFVLVQNPEDPTFGYLQKAIGQGQNIVRVTGRLQGWMGRWPTVLEKLPGKPRRIMVTGFANSKE